MRLQLLSELKVQANSRQIALVVAGLEVLHHFRPDLHPGLLQNQRAQVQLIGGMLGHTGLFDLQKQLGFTVHRITLQDGFA